MRNFVREREKRYDVRSSPRCFAFRQPDTKSTAIATITMTMHMTDNEYIRPMPKKMSCVIYTNSALKFASVKSPAKLPVTTK